MHDQGGRPPLADQESFASVAEYAPAMLWRGDAQGKCVYLNRAQRVFWGVPDDGVDAFTWASTLLAEDAALVYGPFSEGMEKRQPFQCEARYRRADGAIRILRTHAEPRFDENGVFTGMIGVNEDVTEERQAQAELAESEARLRALADNLPYGMVYQIVAAPDGNPRFSFVSSRCEELNGVKAEAAMADPTVLYNLIAPEHRAEFAEAEQRARETLSTFEIETQICRPDGEMRWVRMASSPRRLPNGEIVWDGLQVDIHDLKTAEERRRLQFNEMHHRIKNVLTIVHSIAVQTGRSAETVEAFNATFEARLRALSKSHDLLLNDATDTADLRAILEAELRPYADAGRSLNLNGGAVRLDARAAVGLAIVVHELATNAAKYGAYSAGGALDVSWTHDAGSVVLRWRESGGPPVTEPKRRGFGSSLVVRVSENDLGGAAVLRFPPTGLEAEIRFRPAGGAG